MAAKPRGLVFFGKGAPKVTKAGAATAAEYLEKGEATSDITVLVGAPAKPAKSVQAAPTPLLASEQVSASAAAGGVGSMFKPKAKALAQAPKPAQAKALLAQAAAKAQQAKQKASLSKYDEDLQTYGMSILSEENENPYAIEGVRPVFPLQTRLGFQEHVLEVFDEFNKPPEFGQEPDFDACKKMSASQATKFEYHSQQKFVREFLRQASPYRGMLIYHGLGVGKTCASIAAAQALFSVSKKRIIVMTPFSLRDNFINELSFCGFRHYRLQNYWVGLEANPMVKLFAKEVLQLPESFVSRATKIWIPDFSQPKPNYGEKTDEERAAIKAQVQAQVNARFTFISYNGITAAKLKEIACAPPDEDGYGFFDNATIVIDEIHNLTRLMQGTIEPYLTNLPGLKRKVPLEPITPGRWQPALCAKATDPARPYLTTYKRGYLLYRLLATARNSKIIGLSGTPLINFPEELAILMNLLGGYIYTSSFALTPSSPEAKETVEKVLKENPYVDYQQVDLAGGNMNVMFTILPEGMMKQLGASGKLGVRRVAPGVKFPTIEELTESVLTTLSEQGITPTKAAEFKAEPLLPPIGEEFRANFLTPKNTLKNDLVLRKRIQGLVSYYRGNKKELMPEVTVDELVRVPMTPYSQAEYQRVRAAELNATKDKKKAGGQDALAGVGGKMGNLWSQIYELSQPKQANSYRMFSRQAGNFAFPEGITRPRPQQKGDFKTEFGEDKILFMDQAAEERPGEEGIEIRELGGEEAAAAKEEEEIDEGQKAEFVEELDEEEKEAVEKEEAPDVIGELEAVAVAPLPAVAPPLGGVKTEAAPGQPVKRTLTAAQLFAQQRAKQLEVCKVGLQPGEAYPVATRRAKNCLENFANNKLRMFGLGKKFREEMEAGSEPDPERLVKYSPKFVEILKRIATAPGSSLVYSQFLDMEGIGIFNIVMKLNEFEPIIIQQDPSTGRLFFTPETIQSLKKGDKVWRYMSFTGGETPAVRSLYLRLFNAKFTPSGEAEEAEAEGEEEEQAEATGGRFNELPPEMSKVLVDAGFTGNLHGELCRVFCITSAGAEGLSLRNVRRVHIMEPYWNHVRTDQVKGRAVRICSHVDLEYSSDPALNERTVEVYTYCSVFSNEAQIRGSASGAAAVAAAAGSHYPPIDNAIVANDSLKPEEAREAGLPIPAGAQQYVLTSDEYLYNISANKKALLEEIQNLMKTSSVDCQLNYYENQEDGLGCIKLKGSPEQYAFHPILRTDIQKTAIEFGQGALEVAQAGPEEGGELELSPEAASGAAAAPEAKAEVKTKAKAKATVQAVALKINGRDFLAVPVQEPGSKLVLQYKLFGRGDVMMTKQLGIMTADAEGKPTKKITLF